MIFPIMLQPFHADSFNVTAEMILLTNTTIIRMTSMLQQFLRIMRIALCYSRNLAFYNEAATINADNFNVTAGTDFY